MSSRATTGLFSPPAVGQQAPGSPTRRIASRTAPSRRPPLPPPRRGAKKPPDRRQPSGGWGFRQTSPIVNPLSAAIGRVRDPTLVPRCHPVPPEPLAENAPTPAPARDAAGRWGVPATRPRSRPARGRHRGAGQGEARTPERSRVLGTATGSTRWRAPASATNISESVVHIEAPRPLHRRGHSRCISLVRRARRRRASAGLQPRRFHLVTVSAPGHRGHRHRRDLPPAPPRPAPAALRVDFARSSAPPWRSASRSAPVRRRVRRPTPRASSTAPAAPAPAAAPPCSSAGGCRTASSTPSPRPGPSDGPGARAPAPPPCGRVGRRAADGVDDESRGGWSARRGAGSARGADMGRGGKPSQACGLPPSLDQWMVKLTLWLGSPGGDPAHSGEHPEQVGPRPEVGELGGGVVRREAARPGLARVGAPGPREARLLLGGGADVRISPALTAQVDHARAGDERGREEARRDAPFALP